jgi:hypothetical protein
LECCKNAMALRGLGNIAIFRQSVGFLVPTHPKTYRSRKGQLRAIHSVKEVSQAEHNIWS